MKKSAKKKIEKITPKFKTWDEVLEFMSSVTAGHGEPSEGKSISRQHDSDNPLLGSSGY